MLKGHASCINAKRELNNLAEAYGRDPKNEEIRTL